MAQFQTYEESTICPYNGHGMCESTLMTCEVGTSGRYPCGVYHIEIPTNGAQFTAMAKIVVVAMQEEALCAAQGSRPCTQDEGFYIIQHAAKAAKE